jgi:hypothetical protein
MNMPYYEIVLRELRTNIAVSRRVWGANARFALCAAMGLGNFNPPVGTLESACVMAGAYTVKPVDQKYQIISIVRAEDPRAEPRTKGTRIPEGPASNAMDAFFVDVVDPND